MEVYLLVLTNTALLFILEKASLLNIPIYGKKNRNHCVQTKTQLTALYHKQLPYALYATPLPGMIYHVIFAAASHFPAKKRSILKSPLRALFNTECRKTKTKAITLGSHKGHRQVNEPIKPHRKYV